MKKIAVAVAMMAAASLAYAGYNNTPPVRVDVKNRNAQGTLGGAHNSADAQQYIGCTLTARPGLAQELTCYAYDTSGGYAYCWSTDPGLVAVAATINPITFIFFEWDAGGQCTRITVANSSMPTPPR